MQRRLRRYWALDHELTELVRLRLRLDGLAEVHSLFEGPALFDIASCGKWRPGNRSVWRRRKVSIRLPPYDTPGILTMVSNFRYQTTSSAYKE
jgi:hypothetical protein